MVFKFFIEVFVCMFFFIYIFFGFLGFRLFILGFRFYAGVVSVILFIGNEEEVWSIGVGEDEVVFG